MCAFEEVPIRPGGESYKIKPLTELRNLVGDLGLAKVSLFFV